MGVGSKSIEVEVPKHSESQIPFPEWERLEYGLYWFHIPAGTSTLEVTGRRDLDGKEVFRLVSTAESNAFVSIFYPVEDFVESFLDAEGFFSHGINLHLREGRKRKDREVRFDYVKGKARVLKNGIRKAYDIPDKIQDVLSALYVFRIRSELVPGGSVRIPVHDGGKNRILEVRLLKAEEVRTPAGRFRTVKARVHMNFDGLFFKEGDVEVWLTDDSKRIPVMMRTKVRVGSVTARLISEKRGFSPQLDLHP